MTASRHAEEDVGVGLRGSPCRTAISHAFGRNAGHGPHCSPASWTESPGRAPPRVARGNDRHERGRHQHSQESTAHVPSPVVGGPRPSNACTLPTVAASLLIRTAFMEPQGARSRPPARRNRGPPGPPRGHLRRVHRRAKPHVRKSLRLKRFPAWRHRRIQQACGHRVRARGAEPSSGSRGSSVSVEFRRSPPQAFCRAPGTSSRSSARRRPGLGR